MTSREVLKELRSIWETHKNEPASLDDAFFYCMAKDAADAIESLLIFTDMINHLPNCNDCASKNCEFAPGLGATVRYNCPIHVTRAKKEPVEKPENNNKTRECLVDGKKALFHRWGDRQRAVLKFSYFIKLEEMTRAAAIFKEINVVPNGAVVEKFTNTFGIVEFETGAVEEVEPERINFIDDPEGDTK